MRGGGNLVFSFDKKRIWRFPIQLLWIQMDFWVVQNYNFLFS
jgi:hypothetical protein